MPDDRAYCVVTAIAAAPSYSTLPWFLNKRYQPQTARIRPKFQLELYILRQDLALLPSATRIWDTYSTMVPNLRVCGAQKLGQPVPESNFVSEVNRALSQQMHAIA
jgi:hypothetical protein